MTEIYGYRAEVVLYDADGNRLYVDAFMTGPAYAAMVDGGKLQAAVDEAQAAYKFDRLPAAKRLWHVEEA